MKTEDLETKDGHWSEGPEVVLRVCFRVPVRPPGTSAPAALPRAKVTSMRFRMAGDGRLLNSPAFCRATETP